MIEDISEIKPQKTKIVAIQNLISYRLNEALYITIEYYDDEIIATHPDTESWASGDTEFEAIDGLKYEIEDLFHHLMETSDENLSPKLIRWKKHLVFLVLDNQIQNYMKISRIKKLIDSIDELTSYNTFIKLFESKKEKSSTINFLKSFFETNNTGISQWDLKNKK